MIPFDTAASGPVAVVAELPAAVRTALGEAHPIVGVPAPGPVGMWLVSDPALVHQVLTDDRFSTDLPARRPSKRDGSGPTWLRASAVSALDEFTVEASKILAGHIETATHHLCDELAAIPAGQHVDLRKRFVESLTPRAAMVAAARADAAHRGARTAAGTADRELLDATLSTITALTEQTEQSLERGLSALLSDPALLRDAVLGAVPWTTLVHDTTPDQPLPAYLPVRVATAALSLGGAELRAGEVLLLRPVGADSSGGPDRGGYPSGSPARDHAVLALSTLVYRFPNMTAVDDLEAGEGLPAVRLGRAEPSCWTATITDGPTRIFDVRAPHDAVVQIRGVMTDLYRSTDPGACRFCPAPVFGRRELRTFAVYRLDAELPWYVTVEIHRCQCGHCRMITRRTPTVLRPADDLHPSPTPDDLDGPVRTFTIEAVDGTRTATVNARPTDFQLTCNTCGRCFWLATYRILDPTPTWLEMLEIHWCGACSSLSLGPHWADEYRAADADAPPSRIR
ncbi:hypothetical protein ACTD5D_09760 [Nocardia takedensis]|uniref:hypothetical protein n=1 Tax=Nocardia takedensis TaxID=259390 RepID=UPI003F774A33